MQIVADENIPYVKDAFSKLGEVKLVGGREITASHLRDADLLIVRSVTPVNADLIKESRVRFVGSATIGLDHVDLAYLQDRGIGFAYAPGSNANSVAEYVIAAILALRPDSLAGRTLGIIGLGRIGTLVKAKAEALGIKALANDPPLGRAGRTELVALERLLGESDMVTCHVPLTREGADATYHLLNERTLRMLGSAAILINTARGPVVDNAALLEALIKGRLGGAVLDVWEGEPSPEPALINAVTLGTPHIAGYSLDGKIKGTQMLYEAACVFLRRPIEWEPPQGVPQSRPLIVDSSCSMTTAVGLAVRRSYDIRRDDECFRPLANMPNDERARGFDELRANYPPRWEFHNMKVVLSGASSAHKQTLAGLGFTVEKGKS